MNFAEQSPSTELLFQLQKLNRKRLHMPHKLHTDTQACTCTSKLPHPGVGNSACKAWKNEDSSTRIFSTGTHSIKLAYGIISQPAANQVRNLFLCFFFCLWHRKTTGSLGRLPFKQIICQIKQPSFSSI